ncbi:glycerophosphodiester phosphodiesterase family protein [Arthrobacter sp. Sr24]
MPKNFLPSKPILLGRSLRELCILPLRYWFLSSGLFAVLGLWVSPRISDLLLAAVHRAGLSTLTDRTMGTLLSSPISLAILAAAFVLVAASTLICFATLLVIADLQLSGERPSLATVGTRLVRSINRQYRGGAFLVAAQLALLAPLIGFTLFAPVTGSLGMPPFIGREYMKTPLSALLWCSIAAIIVYGIYTTILTLPFSLVRRQPLSKSLLCSLRATRQGGIRLPLVCAIATLGALAASRLGATLLGTAVDALDSVMANTGAAIFAATLAFGILTVATAQGFAFLLVGEARNFLALPANSAKPANPTVPSTKATPAGRPAVPRPAVLTNRVLPHEGFHLRTLLARGTDVRIALRSLVVLAAVCATSAAALPASSNNTAVITELNAASQDSNESTLEALVIGHRGYDSGGVENTIGGLNAAAAMHTDVVEVDFQQTSDGGFVASHDTNLLVLAGQNKSIYEMTTAQVTSTTVTMKGHSETIPTLASYVTRARELSMPLLIELKVTGHEQEGCVEAFLAELDALEALKGNSFHSLDPSVVQKIKAERPELRVGLTIGMLYGALPESPCDFYVIEQASLTPKMIQDAHQQGQDVYAWTVNGDATMRALLREGVDGLVTDHPDTAQSIRGKLSPGSGYVQGDLHNTLLLESRHRNP